MPLTPLTDDEKRRLFMTLDAHTTQNAEIIEDVKTLKQAVMGDKNIGVPGLIDDMTYVKKWISKNKLRTAFITGIFCTIGFEAARIWEWFVGRK